MENKYLEELGKKAVASAPILSSMGSIQKNNGLHAAADALLKRKDEILSANSIDLENAKKNGMKEHMVDRLLLNESRIAGMAEGLEKLIELDDPIGEVLNMKKSPNGLMIGRKRVPLGVVGIIYEARPNVTADAFGLCFKTGNAVILKGGSDAINSNKKIVEILRESLKSVGAPEDAVSLIEDTNRQTTTEFMTMREYVDVLIPRGSAGLIKATVDNSKIPVIETGTGNCHVYVDESADIEMAVNIIENAKTQRISVCNTCESVVVHKNIAEKFIPEMVENLKKHNVEIRGDENICRISDYVIPATEDDWGREYLDYIISVKTVSSFDEAVAHINKYNTKHSEAIITENYENANRFLDEIDAAAVYVNASTRFTDGFEFGFGAEIGISTQKLHARGPMGLEALTTTKFIIYGNGQVRK